MTEWFEQWFGEEYLNLYPHRDETEAEQVVALIDSITPLRERWVLDLACGPGRHASGLAARGARVVGFDLSMPLLARAHRRTGTTVRLVRGDMRHLPFAPASFDITVNLFTSFGYFSDDRQHEAVIREVAALLRRGGSFVLDYFNAARVRATLVPHEERVVGSQRIVIERRISEDDRFVIKEMHLLDDGRSFVERVRMFAAEEMVELLTAAGLRVRHRLGDYDGSPASDDSPRLILVAERT
ncbi:MAG: methyltransferase domain-containing protein [Gemmatimonadetes bacterium]|nr:methyltransferase domain-containing protein [Gemmatimonadota bacterium]